MKGLHHTHHIVENDDGFTLAQSFLLYDIMLEIDQICRLVTEIVRTQAV